MEDHYFGSLDRRVLGYIQDVEWHLWKLGVPTTTRHNEVAPSQYEMAPIFEAIGVACDHNMMMMEVMKEVAREHDFACLLHEKPFAGVNGSGKHNNWSVSTNTGENLMEPGASPAKNKQFLVVLAAVVRMVSVHGDLLRIAISQHGNDFRLGANEAPPAIMSVYVGDQLLKVIDEIVTPLSNKLERMPSSLLLGVNSLPPLPRDLSDRNRTSPFAFTGNKFEFRAVGSSQACARPGMILNTLFADSVNYLADEIEAARAKGLSLDIAIANVSTTVLKEHYGAVFNGNGYSEEWKGIASKRGLRNLRTAPEAIREFNSAKNITLFEKLGILKSREVIAQQTILYENFIKTVAIELDCLISMIQTYIIPACLEYKQRLITTATAPGLDSILKEYDTNLVALVEHLANLKKLKHEGKELHDEELDGLDKQARFYRNTVMDAMIDARKFADLLETLTDDKLWPFPKYAEILFLK